ncbi:hypothetical protein EV131_11474 [Rhizobium laguerreae]|uniref:Uncharacterized protein n=2 Tax=Rhizobium laguerreae TaxID=1076926 RepID=A0AAX2QFP2_9HYPH|nr:hypothetical protein EV131_11474 [Rhizobium laguerreae]
MIEAIGILARGNEGLIEVNYNEFFCSMTYGMMGV